MSEKSPLVVYHKISESLDCSDGFAAAFVFWLKHGDNYEYAPAMYHHRHPISLFEDRKVIFVDFAYDQVELMDDIASVASEFLLLDHHKTSMLNLGTRPYAVIDLNKSGSLLAWEYCFPDTPVPSLIRHITDHDTGKREDVRTKPFIQRLRSFSADFVTWQSLLHKLDSEDFYLEFISQGALLAESHINHCTILASSAFPIVLAGVEGLAVNSNRFYSHDVGKILADKCGTYGASFFFRGDGNVEFSLTAAQGFDVERIAFKYNGGGHTSAAGFSMPLASFNSIVDLSNKNVSFYLSLQTYIDEFFQSYIAPTYSESTGSIIAQALSIYLNSKLGAVVDELQIQVTTSMIKPKPFSIRIMSRLAKLFCCPAVSDKPKWYHRIFPYSIKRVSEFNDTQIQELLELSKDSGDTKDAREFIVNNLMQTVNYRYEATLTESDSYSARVCVNFPNSSFFIQHQFEA